MTESVPPTQVFQGLAQHAAIYAVSRVLLSGLDLFLLPVYARVLTPDAYGLVAIASAVIAILAIVYPLGLDSALGRFFFDHEPGTEAHRRVVATIVMGSTASALLVAGVLSGLGVSAFGRLIVGMPTAIYQLVVWAALFHGLTQLCLYLLQIRREPGRYLSLSLAQSVLRGALTLLLVVGLRRGALGWAQAYLVSGVGGVAVAVFYLRRTMPMAVRIDTQVLRSAFAYGLPLLVHQLAGWTSVYASRFILSHLVSLAAVGTLQVALAIGQVLGLVTTAVNFAYVPFFMATAARSAHDAGHRFGWFSTYYLAGIVGLALLLSVFAAEVTNIAASANFAAAVPLIPIVLAAFVLQGFYYLLASPIYFRKPMTRYLPLVTLTGGIVSAAGSYILIGQMGIVGAAWAWLLANLATVCVAYPLSQKALRMRYELGRILVFGAVATVLVILSRGVEALRLSEVASLLSKLGLVSVYLGALVGLKVLTRSSAQRMASILVSGWRSGPGTS